MLDNVKIIKDDDKKFAVISYDEFLLLKKLLSDEKELEDYLDYLHIQNVKKKSKKKFSFEEIEDVLK